ncbi:SDR family oxidoreductase [Cupriavidus basilensis]
MRVPNCNLMGPVKAALEASCRYTGARTAGLERHSRARHLPGPLKTRAASGLRISGQLLADAAGRAPVGELVDIMDVGFATAYLATPYARGGFPATRSPRRRRRAHHGLRRRPD